MTKRLGEILFGYLLILISVTNQNCNNSASTGRKGFDVVILNGRVIDPESNLDAVRNIGIIEGGIQLIATKEISGKTSINAHGLDITV